MASLRSILEQLELCRQAPSLEWWAECESLLPPFLLERQAAIERLALALAERPLLSAEELARVEAIRQESIVLIENVRRYRESLISDLPSATRQKSLIDCIANLTAPSRCTPKIDL